MNTQKQVTITDLKGKFNKDFDTFGKMDPFLEFLVGKSFSKTEIASGGGKQPSWKESIVLTYFDQTHIVVKAYDDDVTEKQFIGTAKIQIKSLRFPGGSIEFTILTDNGQNIGTITAKYTIKNLPQSPMILLKNFRLQLATQNKQILKSKPYIQFSTDQNSTATEAKQEIKGLSVSWLQNLRLKIKQSSKITISLIDKDNQQDYIFKYECYAKEFRLQNGVKKFNVFNKKFERFATFHFDYETVNLVSKQESVKNIQKEKKAENQLSAIMIERFTNELKVEGKDIYFKLIVGNNSYTSELFEKNQKLFTVQIKKTLYAEEKQNKLLLVLFSKKLISDQILGSGNISLDLLFGGEKKINLFNQQKQDIGTTTLTFSHKTTPCKVINIDNLNLNLFQGGDLIGQSEPFIVAKIGNCSGNTQVGESHRVTFKKAIQLKYCDEQYLEMQIWDEDANTSQLIYTQKVKLSEFKNKGQHQLAYKIQQEGKSFTKAKLTFRYELKNNASQELSAKKLTTENKIADTQSPKKQVILGNSNKAINSVQVQKQKPKTETERQKKVSEVLKKEEPAPVIQKPLQNQESKPVVIQDKKQQNQTQRLKEVIRNDQPITKRKESIKKSIRQDGIGDNKQRESLVLPSIIADSKFFGDKIFDKQSAATLQKSILSYSMPKAMRFSNEPKYTGEPTYCMDSCFRPNSNKGVGFGFGGKRQFPQWMERNMKENPPPGAYFDDKNGLASKGPTFGLSHKYYQKVVIPKEQKSVTTGQNVRKLSPIRQPPK